METRCVTIAFTLAWRSLASRPARSFTAALGIAVGIATVLSVQVVDRNTILTQERLASRQALGRPDVQIRPLAPGLPPGGAAPAAFAGDRDLESFCGLFFASASCVVEGRGETPREVELAGVGPLAADVFSAYAVASGSDLARADADEALVPAALAAEFGGKVGDRVTLRRLAPARPRCGAGGGGQGGGGRLRALGLTRGEIARAVLLEGLLLSALGALLGLVLTVGLVGFMAARHITTLGADKPLAIVDVPWGLAAGIVGLGTLFALLGMAAPLLRARSLSVLDALRAGRLALRSDAGFSLRVGTLMGVPLLIPLLYALATPPLGERQSEVYPLVLGIAAVVGAFFVLLLAFPAAPQMAVGLLIRPWRAALPVEARLAGSAARAARQRIQGTLAGLAVVVAAVFVVRAVNDGFLHEAARFPRAAPPGPRGGQN